MVFKKGLTEKCKKGKYAVEYNNKIAKVRRRLVWDKKNAEKMFNSLKKDKNYSDIKKYKC